MATTSFPFPMELAGNGGLAGVTIGYNFRLNDQFVIGIEADGSFSTLDTDPEGIPFLDTADERLESLLTLRARLGITQGPVMAYGTLGLAGGNAGYSATVVDFGKGPPVPYAPAEASAFVTGVVGGVGVEVAVNESISLKAEALMYQMSSLHASGDSDTDDPEGGAFDSEYTPSGMVIRTGINFHF
nr:outer membrane beta-barrel protein [Devosia sp.]